jgi:hypothetical protein
LSWSGSLKVKLAPAIFNVHIRILSETEPGLNSNTFSSEKILSRQ